MPWIVWDSAKHRLRALIAATWGQQVGAPAAEGCRESYTELHSGCGLPRPATAGHSPKSFPPGGGAAGGAAGAPAHPVLARHHG